MLRTVRLFGLFTTRSPLSHIGKTVSTGSFLVREPIVQPNGTLERVFCYSGNAWRGQLRDLAAAYMLTKIKAKVPLEAFHLLFSGGRIGGEQKTDIDAARAMRRAIPMVSMFGGGIGNQILPGKMKVGNCYPVCREALPAMPDHLRELAQGLSYRNMAFEKEFTRKDDSKDDRLLPHMQGVEDLLLGTEQRKKEGPADQMRMRSELLAAGVHLYSEIQIVDASEVELGALVSALHSFARSPYIGGQANKGHGLVTLDYQMLDCETGETIPFLAVGSNLSQLSTTAQRAKDSYDNHLHTLYEQALADNGGEMKRLLGAA